MPTETRAGPTGRATGPAGHPPAQRAAIKDHLPHLERLGLEAIED